MRFVRKRRHSCAMDKHFYSQQNQTKQPDLSCCVNAQIYLTSHGQGRAQSANCSRKKVYTWALLHLFSSFVPSASWSLSPRLPFLMTVKPWHIFGPSCQTSYSWKKPVFDNVFRVCVCVWIYSTVRLREGGWGVGGGWIHESHKCLDGKLRSGPRLITCLSVR